MRRNAGGGSCRGAGRHVRPRGHALDGATSAARCREPAPLPRCRFWPRRSHASPDFASARRRVTAGIVVEGLAKSFRRGLAGGRVRALDGVSLAIAPGEAFGIIGPNGAGKTTFLGCLLGFLRPETGRITIDGHDPDDLS